MFKSIRIQFVHPCRAQCAWCSTHRKNPIFQDLQDTGSALDFYDTYLRVIDAHRPKELFISGGEPLLDPQIGRFLTRAAELVDTIHLFTSYQFSRTAMSGIIKIPMPDCVILNHTPIYFEPDRWKKLTNGFPFEVYINNIRDAVQLSVRKRFKFIVNHSRLHEEIQRFSDYVKPNETCEVSLKLMNDQGDGLVRENMARSAHVVRSRLSDLDGLLTETGWTQTSRPKGSADLMKAMIESGDVNACPYRQEPLELRLSYAGGSGGRQVLKYRYCPYFPPESGHRFHLGRDPINKMGKNYHRGHFKDHCDRCRLTNYQTDQTDINQTNKGLKIIQ